MSNPALFLLPTEEKFDGSNWMTFKTMITEAACGRGLLEYLEGKIRNPLLEKEGSAAQTPIPTALTTWWGAADPMPDE